MAEEPLHELAQRLPDMRRIAGLEKQEALQLLSNQDTQDAMEAMLSRLLGRPLDFDRELDPDLNGGTMVSMLLVALSSRSFFTPGDVSSVMTEQAKRFTAEFMRLADILAVPDETVDLGEFVAVYETTRSVFNPWMRGEAQAIIMEIAERLEGLTVFDATSLFLEHKLVNMRKRYVTRRLAAKLAPLTARALERLEGRLAAELDNGERARLARRAGLYRAKLEFYLVMAAEDA
jgi:hypothetical protein